MNRMEEIISKIAKAALEAMKKGTETKVNKAGKIRGIAERLLSIGNKLDQAGKSPDAADIKSLKAIAAELGSVTERYPSPKAKTEKEMSFTDFETFAETEIINAVSEDDENRIALLQENLESVGVQLAENAETEVLKVTVFTDSDQQQSTSSETDAANLQTTSNMEAFMKGLEALAEKAKKPEGEEESNKDKGVKPEGEGMPPKDNTVKNDDSAVSWPADINKGRKLSDVEQWGSVQKGDNGDAKIDFGSDPEECRS